MVPLWLRHRAIAVFLVDGAPGASLDAFAARAAGVLELSIRYTDRLAGARHRQRATAGAELQQLLLPPRIAGMRGAELAGSVLPAYDVGGDWFDHIADRDGAWLALADAAGKGAARVGPQRAVAGRVARDARGRQIARRAAGEMDRAILGFGDPSMFVTALLARWNYADRTLEWLSFGHPQPCRITASGGSTISSGTVLPPLGTALRPAVRHHARRRSGPATASCSISDGVIERRSGDDRLGIAGLTPTSDRPPSRRPRRC